MSTGRYYLIDDAANRWLYCTENRDITTISNWDIPDFANNILPQWNLTTLIWHEDAAAAVVTVDDDLMVLGFCWPRRFLPGEAPDQTDSEWVQDAAIWMRPGQWSERETIFNDAFSNAVIGPRTGPSVVLDQILADTTGETHEPDGILDDPARASEHRVHLLMLEAVLRADPDHVRVEGLRMLLALRGHQPMSGARDLLDVSPA